MEARMPNDEKKRQTKARMNFWTLRFSGRDLHLEPEFLDRFFETNLPHRRMCHLYTIFFYAVTGLIDFYMFPETVKFFFLIRYVVVVPIFLAGLAFTYTGFYQKYHHPIHVGYILVTGCSFIAFAAMAAPPWGYDYWVGIVFCMVFGYTFIRERYIYASLAGTTLLIASILVFSLLIDAPEEVVMQSSFYLFFVNLLGILIARHLELSARKDFYLEHKLLEEKETVARLNAELERRVKERTAALSASNEQLSQNVSALKLSEAERSRLELQLRQAYKMEAIGTLAGGIAHDFNNILSSVLGFTELALDGIDPDCDLYEYLQEVYVGGKRARELVKQILTFARQTAEKPQPVQVYCVVKEVAKLLRSSIPTNIDIQTEIQSEAFIMGDPINIHQIIMNLATNASHAMESGGILTISLDEQFVSGDSNHRLTHLTPGNYLLLAVTDTGTGISTDIIESIFEPYFTTKDGGHGTGMGLAMVYGIVKKYQGEIIVDSEPGKGSTFSLYLPITEKRSISPHYESIDLPRGEERILIVDDEYPIARLLGQILDGLGYQVIIEGNSKTALTLFQRDPDAFDLVITDTMMPDLTGDELARELLSLKPDLPIIICTGFTDRIDPATIADIGIRKMMYKPILKKELARTVRNVLDADYMV